MRLRPHPESKPPSHLGGGESRAANPRYKLLGQALSRLFRKQLNASPSKFVERVRIDQARRALLETEAQIENVAIQCGFGSLRRMDRAFTRAISATPTEFRARFKPPGPTA